MRRARALLSRLLLILFALMLSFAMLEVALRLIPLPSALALNRQLLAQWQPDDELLMHLQPNLDLRITGHPEFRYSVRTNRDGLRLPTAEGQAAIAAIGDSFTFGFGVEGEQAWPAQLAQVSGLPVANLGWAGWNSRVYPAALRRHAVPSGARIWVWAFFVNDLRESAGADDFLASGRMDYLATTRRDTATEMPLGLRMLELLGTLLNPELRYLPDSGSRTFDDGRLSMRVSRYPWEQTDPDDAEVQRGWALTEAALVEAQALATASDARLLLVYVPSREQVYWPRLEAAFPEFDGQPLTTAQARLSEIAAAHQIDILDLTPDFMARGAADEMLYFTIDGHWNAAGHALAAQVILARLSRLGWL